MSLVIFLQLYSGFDPNFLDNWQNLSGSVNKVAFNVSKWFFLLIVILFEKKVLYILIVLAFLSGRSMEFWPKFFTRLPKLQSACPVQQFVENILLVFLCFNFFQTLRGKFQFISQKLFRRLSRHFCTPPYENIWM